MVRYPALIDGEDGAFGVVFPDIPGVVAMGSTIDEALINAEAALRDYAVETERDGDELVDASPLQFVKTPPGNQLVSIPLIRTSGKSVRAGLTLDEEVAEFISTEARRRGMTRKAYITWVVRRIAAMGG
ncbi:MAG: type II toxin-antitoxin system HicB family antitoxin [Chloroflexi bacterium]|nr:type II toxin-antitoxin system HicB family antitoxin [Chloroflexota bacterium]